MMKNADRNFSPATALAVAAGTLAALGSAGADAAIVSQTIAPGATSVALPTGEIDFASTTLFAGTDVLGGTYYDQRLFATSTGLVSIGGSTVAAGSLIGPGMAAGSSTTLDSTTAGFVTIKPGIVYGTTSTSNPAIGTGQMLSFEFDDGRHTDYGWLEFDASQANTFDGAYQFKLDAFGYDTTGAAIEAGQVTPVASAVPEPSSLLLLAAGSLGLVAFRRRQAARG